MQISARKEQVRGSLLCPLVCNHCRPPGDADWCWLMVLVGVGWGCLVQAGDDWCQVHEAFLKVAQLVGHHALSEEFVKENQKEVLDATHGCGQHTIRRVLVQSVESGASDSDCVFASNSDSDSVSTSASASDSDCVFDSDSNGVFDSISVSVSMFASAFASYFVSDSVHVAVSVSGPHTLCNGPHTICDGSHTL